MTRLTSSVAQAAATVEARRDADSEPSEQSVRQGVAPVSIFVLTSDQRNSATDADRDYYARPLASVDGRQGELKYR